MRIHVVIDGSNGKCGVGWPGKKDELPRANAEFPAISISRNLSC